MPHWAGFRTRAMLLLGASCLLFCFGCAGKSQEPDPLDGAKENFAICWPPRDPEDPTEAAARPLLRGAIALDAREGIDGESELRLAVTITRPSDESDRQFWNSQLAFADISWMDEVRVWDAKSQWLWPNLPYLLRRPGRERVERYGGVDPGKQEDNDFAAVLIRKYDSSGTIEATETKDSPLVSAEWHAGGSAKSDIQTVEHVAKSDTFVVHLGGDNRPARGRLKVWLIYADFLGSRPPPSWPSEREWAGGILAYLEIDWETIPGQPCRGALRHQVPQESTGFEWSQWASGTANSAAMARLADRPSD